MAIKRILFLWQIVVLAAPLWWVLGFNLFFYHFMALLFFVTLLHEHQRTHQPLYIPPSAVAIGILILIYVCSLAIRSFSSDFSRVLASAYNLSYWVMGWMLLVVFSNDMTENRLRNFVRIWPRFAFVLGMIALCVAIAALLGVRRIIFETPLYGLSQFAAGSVLVKNSLIVRLLQLDFFISSWLPRFNAFSPYPTATGGLYLMTLFMVLSWKTFDSKRKQVPAFLLVVLSIFGLLFTLSRTSVLVFFLTWGVIFLLQRRRAWLWILVAAIGLVFALPWLERGLNTLLDLRAGSTYTRFELYRFSIQQLEGMDWLLGRGLKPRGDEFIYPVGSHSTYVSLLFKTGILGLGVLLVYQLSLLLRWFRLRTEMQAGSHYFALWRGFGWVLLGMTLWMFSEDIDAPQLVAFLYFSLVGCFEGFLNMQRYERK